MTVLRLEIGDAQMARIEWMTKKGQFPSQLELINYGLTLAKRAILKGAHYIEGGYASDPEV